MSRASKGLSKRDRDHLSTALNNLPAQIKYLRDPILAIAKQDQELLGSGEADTNLLANALRENSKGSLEEEAEAAADLLQGWIEGEDGNESPWAGPVWFVEGFLRGGQLFGEEGEEAPASTPPVLGLQRIEVDVPKGMKLKLYPAAIVMTNREVQIFVFEWDEKNDQYVYKWGQWRSAPSLPTHPPEIRPPHLRDERDVNFKVGDTTGERRISRHVDSGLPVMCFTLLDLPDLKVDVSMISRKDLGFDLSKYEEFLSSIRRKQP